ncbi:hypothetical protein AYI70_g6857 [Smittium culicis]|uniref:Uncharacterized protein n=1 Tax=Smittium culicis TaxID=133412 RepID=A0A1R1XN40_9FUNG|nr:hypothetical protein AYI70_g6857 [Smittium culicis]
MKEREASYTKRIKTGTINIVKKIENLAGSFKNENLPEDYPMLKINDQDIDKPTALNTVYNLISELVDVKKQNQAKVVLLESRLATIRECLQEISKVSVTSDVDRILINESSNECMNQLLADSSSGSVDDSKSSRDSIQMNKTITIGIL